MKDYKIPFNLFDFFGYLIVGATVFAIVYCLFYKSIWMTHLRYFFDPISSISYFNFLIIIVGVYIIGHIVSLFGSLILEKGIVQSILGYPSKNFFDRSKLIHVKADKKPWKKELIRKIKNKMFKAYREPYSNDLADKIKNIYKKMTGLEFNHYEAFSFCFHTVKENCPITYGRLMTFLSLYDFFRNLSTSLIGIAILFFIKTYWLIGLLTLIFAYLFFLRYIKFYRLYGDEVFRSFYAYSMTI